METIIHDTAKKIKYFDLQEFVDKINLTPNVLSHMEETNKSFKEYFKKLKSDDEFYMYFLVSLARKEKKNSFDIENIAIKDLDFKVGELFFDESTISHNKIHNINKYQLKDDNKSDTSGIYRKKPVKISSIHNNIEEIYAYGANPEDIDKFMDDFIELYKLYDTSTINTNPFLKSSLLHLLFVKIHPYLDGNGRTARNLHNIKFTETINKIYDLDLRISPVTLSESININKISYSKALNGIYFDLDHDNNEMINYWFNCMLNMYDEQLFRNQNIINDENDIRKRIEIVKSKMNNETKKQIDEKIRTLKKVVR